MQVIFDDRFYYSPRAHMKAACHLKVFTANSRVLVLATEVQDNLEWSIARSPEALATQIVNTFQFNPDIIRFIEHYPPRVKQEKSLEGALVRSIDAYFLVNFIWRTTNGALPPYKATRPQRQPLSVVEFVRLMRTTIYMHKQRVL
ncbi:MAG: hypothetical protein JO031_01955 [Ktedonobacteraceae bacterium]|nr:hypothetical protein [Ktedonobacteraceae bacterium]